MSRTFRVYFDDGNQKLYSAGNIIECINYVVYVAGYSASKITKIEEVS